MTEKTYKAVLSEELSKYDDKRYVIVDIESGRILDNAQGHGYKSPQKAYACYAYKKRDRSKDKEKQEKENKIKNWLRENREFTSQLDSEAYWAMKDPAVEFNLKFVKKLLKEQNLEPEFTASEILIFWKKL